MTAKNIPDPTNTSPLVFNYNRQIPPAGLGRMRCSYKISGSSNDSESIPATNAVATAIISLINTMIGYTVTPSTDSVEVTIDTVNLVVTIIVTQPNAFINAEFRAGSFTPAMRTAARAVLAQGLTDGLLTAMGF